MVTAQVAASSETDATLRADDSILGKAFAILGAFSQGSRILSLSQISRLSGIPKSTTHRVLAMLVELGAVERFLGNAAAKASMSSTARSSMNSRVDGAM